MKAKLEKGLIVGNFKLKKPIKDLETFYRLMKKEKSIFMRHRMYPSAFIQNWQIRLIGTWVDMGWVWETTIIKK